MSCRKCAGRTEARKGGQYCERCGYQSGCRTTGEQRDNRTVDASRKSPHHKPMTPDKPAPVDDYSQRYHALSLAASLALPYKKPEDVIQAARKFQQYLAGDKK